MLFFALAGSPINTSHPRFSITRHCPRFQYTLELSRILQTIISCAVLPEMLSDKDPAVCADSIVLDKGIFNASTVLALQISRYLHPLWL